MKPVVFISVILATLAKSASTYAVSISKSVSEPDELLLVHAIFRHGNRTPDDGIYTGNPYGDESFYKPYGFGQLTNEGKRTEYELGQTLRERYDSFLGDEYNINLIDGRTTNKNRTKMSLLLVTASLFPPRQDLIWNRDLNWQPIPYNYYEKDKEIQGHKICTNYKKDYKKLIKSDEIQEKLKIYEDVFEYLSNHTGDTITKPKDVADIYNELNVQKAYGYPIEEWTLKYLPEMKQITLDNYNFMTYKKKLKKIVAGYLIRKIISDTENKIKDVLPTRMYLYSAQEKNIATLLLTLGIFDNKVPSFGSYILIEVHRIDGIYGFKVYYQNYLEEKPTLMTIPGCDTFCPLSTFKDIVSDYIPDDTDCEIE